MAGWMHFFNTGSVSGGFGILRSSLLQTKKYHAPHHRSPMERRHTRFAFPFPAFFVAAFLIACMLGNPAHAAVGDCGQPFSTGTKPTASDALFVLKAAVGSLQCELCVCDADGNGVESATDALLVLKVAVGSALPLLCPSCATTTTTTSSTTTTTVGGSQPSLTAGDFPDVTPCSDRDTLPTDAAFKNVLMNTAQYGYSVWFTQYDADGFPEICGLSDVDNSLPQSAIPWDPHPTGHSSSTMEFLLCLDIPPNVADLLDPFRLPVGHGPEICRTGAQPDPNTFNVEVEAMPRAGVYRRDACIEAGGSSYDMRTRYTVSGPAADKTLNQLGITRQDIRICDGSTELVTMAQLRAFVAADPANVQLQVRQGSCSGTLLLNVLAETVCVHKRTSQCDALSGSPFCS